MCRRRATANLGLVDDIVVIQRGEMNELESGRRQIGGRAIGSPRMGTEQHEGRAESLAAGLDQMGGGFGDQGMRRRTGGGHQDVLDALHVGGEPLGKRRGTAHYSPST
jgi:hypothetical protein